MKNKVVIIALSILIVVVAAVLVITGLAKSGNNSSEISDGSAQQGMDQIDLNDDSAQGVTVDLDTGSVISKPDDKNESQQSGSANSLGEQSSSGVIKPPSNTTSELTGKELVTILTVDSVKVEAPKNTFPNNTVVKVTEIKQDKITAVVKSSLNSVATKYVTYDITAMKNNVSVQPNGKVRVTFDIPNGYNADKVKVLYISDNGNMEEVLSSLDKTKKKVIAELSHFSMYAVVEVKDNVESNTSSDVSSSSSSSATSSNLSSITGSTSSSVTGSTSSVESDSSSVVSSKPSTVVDPDNDMQGMTPWQ